MDRLIEFLEAINQAHQQAVIWEKSLRGQPP